VVFWHLLSNGIHHSWGQNTTTIPVWEWNIIRSLSYPEDSTTVPEWNLITTVPRQRHCGTGMKPHPIMEIKLHAEFCRDYLKQASTKHQSHYISYNNDRNVVKWLLGRHVLGQIKSLKSRSFVGLCPGPTGACKAAPRPTASNSVGPPNFNSWIHPCKPFKMKPYLLKFHHPFARYEMWSLYFQTEYLEYSMWLDWEFNPEPVYHYSNHWATQTDIQSSITYTSIVYFSNAYAKLDLANFSSADKFFMRHI
jgi:hypothetical protein